MGDFEDVFGSGADAVDIIEGYSREYERGSTRRKPNGRSTTTHRDSKSEDTERQDELSSWSASMVARGYTKGPVFPSYEDLSVWDRSNTRPHVRRSSYRGYLVYFTDGQPYVANTDVSISIKSPPPSFSDDEIPF